MVSEKEFGESVAALLATMDAKLAHQFLEGLKKVKDDIDIDEIAGFIQDGQYEVLFNKISVELVNKGFTGFSLVLTDAYLAGGKLAAKLGGPIPTSSGELAIVFDAINPKLTQVMSYYKMGKIQQITEDIRESIRRTINDSVNAGMSPKDTAKEIRAYIGLTRQQQQAVNNFKQLLINKPAEAMHRELRDKTFDTVLARMIRNKETIPAQKIEQMVEAYRQKYITHRAVTIARTESIRALNMASRQIWTDLVSEGQVPEENVVRVWLANIDNKTRDSHRALHKKRVGLNEAFKSSLGDIMYPGDPLASPDNVINCRCTIFHRITVED
jgi:hypothetical protein